MHHTTLYLLLLLHCIHYTIHIYHTTCMHTPYCTADILYYTHTPPTTHYTTQIILLLNMEYTTHLHHILLHNTHTILSTTQLHAIHYSYTPPTHIYIPLPTYTHTQTHHSLFTYCSATSSTSLGSERT